MTLSFRYQTKDQQHYSSHHLYSIVRFISSLHDSRKFSSMFCSLNCFDLNIVLFSLTFELDVTCSLDFIFHSLSSSIHVKTKWSGGDKLGRYPIEEQISLTVCTAKCLIKSTLE